MDASIAVLLAFTAWTVFLAALYVGYRIVLVLTRKTAANSWTRGNPSWEDPAWVIRAQHAHLNCLESLPLYAAIVLAAGLLDKTGVVDGLAFVYLGFRLAQSIIHLISASAVFVFLRANMLAVQWGCLIYWLMALGGVI